MIDFQEDPSADKSIDFQEEGPSRSFGEKVGGAVDAAASMVAGSPAQIAGGLYGLSTLLSGQGLDQANKNLEKVQKSNFGFGEYKPATEVGEEYAGKVSSALDKPVEWAGNLGEKIAGNEGRLAGELWTRSAMELIDPTVGVGLAARGLSRRKPKVTPEAAPSKTDAAFAKEKAIAEGDALVKEINALPETIPVTREGQGIVGPNDAMFREQAQLRQRAAQAAQPNELFQTELFDHPESGRPPMANEAVPGDWRIDENGMPFKADLSMEAANLETPLQRNLFGDELDPKHSQEAYPLTQAIDSMPKGEDRTAGIDMLSHDIKDVQGSLGRLERAAMDAELRANTPRSESPMIVPKGQRGAIDVKAIKEGLEQLRLGKLNPMQYFDLFKGAFDERTLSDIKMDLADPKSRSTVVLLSPREFLNLAKPREDVILKETSPRLRDNIREGLSSEKGLREVPQLWVDTDRGVAYIKGHEGRHRMDVFKEMGIDKIPVVIRDASIRWGEADTLPHSIRPEGLALTNVLDKEFPKPINQVVKSPGNRQMGGVFMGQTGANAVPVPKQPKPTLTPEQIAAKESQRKFVQRFPAKDKALDEFDVIRTKEEAIELGKTTKDISTDYGQKNLGSGINFQAIMTNNPVLKFARTVFRDARVKAEQFSKKYITDKKVGLSPVWSNLNAKERVGVIEALMAGDRHQMKVTPSIMDSLGFTEKQRQFVETFYKADEAMFKDWNTELASVGLKTVRERTGHFPGIFTGAYKTLVMDASGKKTLGVLATDTKAQQKVAQQYIRDQFPDAKFVEQKRASLTGTANRYYSDIFSGMHDVLEILGKEDPKFLEVQQMVSGMVTKANNKLFNFNVHELSKKGVFGNEGSRPWLSPERNANDAFKALVRYFEEGAEHHALQVPLKEVKDVANSAELKHLPNTMKYLDAYTKKITGDDLSPLGGAINTIIDAPFRLTPTVSWGKGKYAVGIGVGPSVPLKMAGAVKNTMSQVFMGFGNYMFTASQLVQPGQTGLPFMQLAASRLGMSVTDTTASMGRGGVHFLLAMTEQLTGKTVDMLPAHMREAYQYARDRGLLEFSEMERAYQGTQSKFGRTKDQIAELNMKLGEQMTRAPMLMAFTDLLVRGGLDVKKALPIAENLTQFSMIDYHVWERPMVYSKAGVIGQFAGGLTTFKHGFTSQQVKLGKEMVSPVQGKHQALPVVMSVTAMLTLAGITGMPFYGEADTAVQWLTDKFGGEGKTIRELFLRNSPEWLNSGLVSNATGLNIQGKFSSADMIPDSIAKGASPHLEAFGRIIGDVIDFAKSGGDEQAVRNLLLDVTPSGWKGVTENKMARNADNQLIGRDGLPAVNRTDTEWKKRIATGLRPQTEAIEREGTWAARQKQLRDAARLKDIAEEYKRAIINNTIDAKAEKLQEEYMQRGGDIKTLIELETAVPQLFGSTQKERLEGVPKTPQGINRFQYYNK